MKEAKSPPPGSGNALKPASLSPGMATLLHGGNGAGKADAEMAQPTGPPPETRRRKRLLQGSLFLADALLVGLAARLMAGSGGHVGFGGIALCVLAFVVGAWLTCLALWPETKP